MGVLNGIEKSAGVNKQQDAGGYSSPADFWLDVITVE